MSLLRNILAFLLAGSAIALPAHAQDHDGQSADALARQLSNPIASLISVPFQLNADFGAGANEDVSTYTLNIQPVIPVRLNSEWNLISRTVLPVVGREGPLAPGASSLGVGDTLQSFFFSPADPTGNGLIWGVGPVLLAPTASTDSLGSGQWGIGPTAVVLRQGGRWTTGALVNHLWGAGDGDDGEPVDRSFVQPFVGYAIGRGQTLQLSVEATYAWNGEQWTAPLNMSYARVISVRRQRMSFAIGARYFMASPEAGPEWGVRTSVTLLFPRVR